MFISPCCSSAQTDQWCQGFFDWSSFSLNKTVMQTLNYHHMQHKYSNFHSSSLCLYLSFPPHPQGVVLGTLVNFSSSWNDSPVDCVLCRPLHGTETLAQSGIIVRTQDGESASEEVWRSVEVTLQVSEEEQWNEWMNSMFTWVADQRRGRQSRAPSWWRSNTIKRHHSYAAHCGMKWTWSEAPVYLGMWRDYTGLSLN